MKPDESRIAIIGAGQGGLTAAAGVLVQRLHPEFVA
jgi:cation diffusion facilitator CzcD-associated flavoprotein CzcO